MTQNHFRSVWSPGRKDVPAQLASDYPETLLGDHSEGRMNPDPILESGMRMDWKAKGSEARSDSGA